MLTAKCLRSVSGHSVHFRFSASAFRRAKTDKSKGFVVSIQSIPGSFDRYVFNVSLRSFIAFPIFDNFVSRQRLVVKGKGRQFVPISRATWTDI